MPHRTYVAPKPETNLTGAEKLQAQLAEMVALVTDWTAAMNDIYDVSAVLDAAQVRIESRSITLYRLVAGAMRPRLIARTAPSKGTDIPALPNGSLAAFLLERHAESALPGTIWRLSELRDDPSFAASRAFREWVVRPDTAEVTLMVLAHDVDGFDVLELQFETAPLKHDVIRAELLSRTLAHAWGKRQDGLCTRLIVQHSQRHSAGTSAEGRAILASDNPYNLSRAEFRICGLIGQGLRAREISAELGLTEATIRTHMRNIYTKTDASGQIEVMSRLREQASPRSVAAR